ncbi:MAG TPA: 2-oxoglutarate dehydrogenase, E2 component, dihydrolipoamide succinyltransferase, partial [Pseudonocardia sp.]
MAFSVQMPALGESVTEGTVTRWLKQEGDTVELDEPLVEVSTDKVDTEIPSPAAGVLTKIIAQEDDTVEVGGELAVIGDASEGGAPGAPAQAPSQPEPQAAAPPQPEPEPEPAAPARQEPAPAAPARDDSGGGAATPVLMPELGESVTEGTVTRWLKKVGDSVQVDEPLVEVSTDKVDTEIPSPVAGVLVSITADEDATVPVGGELARIGVGAEAAAPAPSAPTPPPAPEPEPRADAQPVSRPEAAAKPAPEPRPEAAPKSAPAQAAPAAEADGSAVDGTPYVTPLVRKLATEKSIDLAEVTGTGVGGRIRKQDVLAAAQQKEEAKKAPAPAVQAPTPPTAHAPAAKEPSPAPALAHLRGTTQKASRIRQITAAKTRESLQATAQLTQTHEVDMTRIVWLRARAKASFAEREGVNLTFLPFIAKAVIDALKTHPNINASYNEETKEITYYDAEHLGF